MLNGSFAMSSILSKRSKLSQISNKPDLLPKERNIESMLLKERISLNSTGVYSKLIKLRGISIYVNNVKHGVVVDSVFKLCPLPSNRHLSSENSKPVSSSDQSTDVSVVIPPNHSHNLPIGDLPDVNSMSPANQTLTTNTAS